MFSVCHHNNKKSLCAGVRLATAYETSLFVAPSQWATLSKTVQATGWLPISHSQIRTHTKKETETHMLHFLFHTRNTVAAVFHLNEFLNLFVPSPLAAASWWKMETEGAGCQVNWCVRRERGQNGVIKRKAFPPSHSLTYTHTGSRKRQRERGSGFQTWLQQKSSLVHSLFFTQPSRAALPLRVALY